MQLRNELIIQIQKLTVHFPFAKLWMLDSLSLSPLKEPAQDIGKYSQMKVIFYWNI